METHPPISCVHLVNVYLLTYFGGSLCGCLFSAFLISFLLPSLFCNSIRHYPFRDVCSVWVYSFSFSLILPLWIFTFHVLDCQGLAFAAKVWSPLVSLFWVILTRHFEFFMFWFDFLLWVIFLICCCV